MSGINFEEKNPEGDIHILVPDTGYSLEAITLTGYHPFETEGPGDSLYATLFHLTPSVAYSGGVRGFAVSLFPEVVARLGQSPDQIDAVAKNLPLPGIGANSPVVYSHKSFSFGSLIFAYAYHFIETCFNSQQAISRMEGSDPSHPIPPMIVQPPLFMSVRHSRLNEICIETLNSEAAELYDVATSIPFWAAQYIEEMKPANRGYIAGRITPFGS